MNEGKEAIKKRKTSKRKKKNVKLFPFYKMISWDLLFYYPIIFLFLTQVKGFSPAQALFADTFYTLANTFWQIPATWIIDKIGKRNSLIIGNILYSVTILAMIFMKSYITLLIIQFFYALGFSIKALCENNILYDSLPAHTIRGKLYSEIDARASSNFFYFDALSSVIAGVTFAINGYIPMVLCFITCVLCTISTFKFNHTTIDNERVKAISLKEYSGQVKDAFKFFRKSKRVKSLFIFNAIFTGILLGVVNLRSSMLKEMMVPEAWFGIIFAMLEIGAGLLARYQAKIHKFLKNKTLTALALPVAFSCILIGFIGKDPLSKSSLILIIILYLIQQSIRGPYMGLMSRYLNNFTNKKIRTKISAFKNLTANLATAIFTFICSVLLSMTTTANTFIIVGCIATISVVLILDYMRDKVGLKPENYTKEDVKYSIRKPVLKERKK